MQVWLQSKHLPRPCNAHQSARCGLRKARCEIQLGGNTRLNLETTRDRGFKLRVPNARCSISGELLGVFGFFRLCFFAFCSCCRRLESSHAGAPHGTAVAGR